MRASIFSKRILVTTVALARSTVGTTRATLPRKRASGIASSVISTGMSTRTLATLLSETSASTSSVLMSAIVTTAPEVPAAAEKGVIMSPTLAFLTSTTPSNGARISVLSWLTRCTLTCACACARAALALPIAARPAPTPARAASARRCAASTACDETKPRVRKVCWRWNSTSALAASACACSRLASACRTPAAAWPIAACATSSAACTSLASRRPISSPCCTGLPSRTRNSISRPVPLEATEARRCATT